MSDRSGSWPSGCSEKYPWIGGEERIDPFEAEWAAFSAEQDDATSSRNPMLVHMEEVNRDLIAINRDITERNEALTQRNEDLTQRNLDLTERNQDLSQRNLTLTECNRDLTAHNLHLADRLYATEDTLAQRDEELELTRESSMNQELTERVASLSTYICKMWMELATSKGRERRGRTVIIVMVFVFLLAFVKK